MREIYKKKGSLECFYLKIKQQEKFQISSSAVCLDGLVEQSFWSIKSMGLFLNLDSLIGLVDNRLVG